ncbi:AlbA family DNA-binding domain-containing protein [Methanobacterium oryzae]|uniref:AlbA family DNA-binding domain-containing protein n=1 Tax=Methanobacterium oryzae TaxID=69540 RepID=UPI003D1A0383
MEYQGLSEKAKALLSQEEDYDVDWKRGINGLDSEDFVAFANSKKGGSILIGVEETVDSDGKQIPKIVGCQITDSNKMKIKTKAQNCIPPIEVNIIKENMDETPFYRIEIPSGDKKPYCTGKGTYKIRDDGNNKRIAPDKLLSIFIEVESELFLKRFKEAAKELENDLYITSNQINEVKSYLEDILPEVEGLQEYSYMSDNILGTVNEIEKYVESTEITTVWNEKRILALLNHFNIEDPFVTNLKTMFKHSVIRMSENGINIKDKNYLKDMKKTYFGATKEQLKQWYEEVIEENNL